MRARFAFALSLAIDFECYLVDEVIAAGADIITFGRGALATPDLPNRLAAKLLLSIQNHPGFPHTYRVLAACYAHMGHLAEARSIVARLGAITPQILPSAAQLRSPADRELFLSGLRLAVGEAGPLLTPKPEAHGNSVARKPH